MRHITASARALAGRPIEVAILDDYFDTLHTLPCFAKLAPFEVTIWNDHVEDPGVLGERLQQTEVLVLFRERTRVTAALLDRCQDDDAQSSCS